jgi:hypothetical protein
MEAGRFTPCIEAKSEKRAAISKSDAAQLVLSVPWCRQQVAVDKADIHPVFATDSTTSDRPEDVSFGPRLLTEATIFELPDALRQLVMGLSFDGPLFGDPASASKGLSSRGLLGTIGPRFEVRCDSNVATQPVVS